MDRINTSSKCYVVCDVETNGLRSKYDDLLSISFYKPDDGKTYNKFLPLEFSKKVYTTSINGITKHTLKGAKHLTQQEFDCLIEEFELERRTILIYAGRDFDKYFLSEYLKRHKICGFEKLKFYNFKKEIISSRFSRGGLSKDNLCRLFRIKNVQQVHSGVNDCKLEWRLFKKLGGYYYIVTDGNYIEDDNLFRLNDNYIIPASFLYSHPRISALLKNRPYLECYSTIINSFEIDGRKIKRFSTNITGMTIEHLINAMLDVEEVDSLPFLIKNKSQLEYIGKVRSGFIGIPMEFNTDGTVTVINDEDKKFEKQINSTIRNLKKQLSNLVLYIKETIFDNEKILSQELVINKENNILALCDLSSKKSILEIKTNSVSPESYKEQLFYEAKGRTPYCLNIEWCGNTIIFNIYKVLIKERQLSSTNWVNGKLAEKQVLQTDDLQQYLKPANIIVKKYKNKSIPIILKCNKCGCEWEMKYNKVIAKLPSCPDCEKLLQIKKK